MSRKICLITGSRADYGHMQWLARDIADDANLELQILVTGSHLSPRFGETYREIEADGFVISAKVPLPDGDMSLDVARAVGAATTGLAEALERLDPDIVVILGDRYEMLAAASAALILRIPVAHLHGGEVTEGAFDESIRHAITKMSHLHFTAAEPYARRVRQMGEAPERVFQFGTPGLDALIRSEMMSRQELSASLGFDLVQRFIMISYHPVTLSNAAPAVAVKEMLAALDAFADYRVVISGVNADTGNSEIAAVVQRFAANNEGRALFVDSLGHRRYLSALNFAETLIGNSSSGIVEAPSVGTPSVNIGDRQKGRLRAASVIDCGESRLEIEDAITRALDPDFLKTAWQVEPPYGRSGASVKIKNVLATVSLENIITKPFHDQEPAAT